MGYRVKLGMLLCKSLGINTGKLEVFSVIPTNTGCIVHIGYVLDHDSKETDRIVYEKFVDAANKPHLIPEAMKNTWKISCVPIVSVIDDSYLYDSGDDSDDSDDDDEGLGSGSGAHTNTHTTQSGALPLANDFNNTPTRSRARQKTYILTPEQIQELEKDVANSKRVGLNPALSNSKHLNDILTAGSPSDDSEAGRAGGGSTMEMSKMGRLFMGKRDGKQGGKNGASQTHVDVVGRVGTGSQGNDSLWRAKYKMLKKKMKETSNKLKQVEAENVALKAGQYTPQLDNVTFESNGAGMVDGYGFLIGGKENFSFRTLPRTTTVAVTVGPDMNNDVNDVTTNGSFVSDDFDADFINDLASMVTEEFDEHRKDRQNSNVL